MNFLFLGKRNRYISVVFWHSLIIYINVSGFVSFKAHLYDCHVTLNVVWCVQVLAVLQKKDTVGPLVTFQSTGNTASTTQSNGQ